MKNKLLLICVMLTIITSAAFAKEHSADTSVIKPKLKRFYIGSGFDGGIFSTATIKHTNMYQYNGTVLTQTTNTMGTLRFTYVVNIGITFNLNVSRHFGLYTGLDVKNIGYIDKSSGLTYKYRTYNLGAPIGVKIGNMMPKKTYGFFGAGADIPFNYREKYFSDRNEKTKFNEWFSQRTPAVMPYVFAGMSITHGLSVKLQYYPNNFINPDFIKNGIQPYIGTEVHLMLLSIGFAVPVKEHHDMVKKHVSDLDNK